MWAWAFSVLDRASLDAGGSGVQAEVLLHDCVPSIFFALASVLLSLKFHHYCSWHSITAFAGCLPERYNCKQDLVEPRLIAEVASGALSLSAALVQQRDIVFHAFNAVLLARHERDAAVLFTGFHLKYCTVNPKLVALLSRDPYNDLSALLLCWSEGARAIDANCENFARLVRSLQCTDQGRRMKMRNFAGALVLVCLALFRSARSEHSEAVRAARSQRARAPLYNFHRGASPAIAPASLVTGAQQELLRSPAHCAAAAALPADQLQGILHRDVRGGVLAMADCIPVEEDFGWRLRVAARSHTSGGFTFVDMHRALTVDPFCIVHQAAFASFSAAMQLAETEAERALREQAATCTQHLALDSKDDVALVAMLPAMPPSELSLRASPPTPAALAALAQQMMAGGRFGGSQVAPARATEVPSSALVYSSGVLPLLAPHRGCGRPHDAARQQWSTVTGYGSAYVQITPANKLRILRALDELPRHIKVHYLSPLQLCERQVGVAHSSSKVDSARSAPKKRALCAISLIAAAMRYVRGSTHAADEGSDDESGSDAPAADEGSNDESGSEGGGGA